MPLSATDIVIYGSANMPDADGATAGGAIDTATRVIPASASLWNTLDDTVEIVSSNIGDGDDLTVTVYGRLASGVIDSEGLSLDGTNVVAGAKTFARLLKIVVSGAHLGTITVRKATGDTTLAAIEPGVLEIRRPFYNVGADASGGIARDFYEKVFAKNTHGTKALLDARIFELTDAEAQMSIGLEDAVDDNNSVATRINTAPSGMEATGFTMTEGTITAITKANPAQVTSASHGLSTGDRVAITGVGGMTELNDRLFVVTVVDSNNFTLNGEVSTSYTTYTSGGKFSRGKAVPGGYLAPGAAIGVWLKLTLPAGDPATKTSYTLRVTGDADA